MDQWENSSQCCTLAFTRNVYTEQARSGGHVSWSLKLE